MTLWKNFALVLFLLCCINPCSLPAQDEPTPQLLKSPDTIVVCPEHLQPTMKIWKDYREQQSHRVKFIVPEATAAATRDKIVAAYEGGRLKHVVLVGDSAAVPNATALQQSVLVPTFFVDAKVNIKFGSETKIASDNPYADIDGDGVPELSIGRITADTKPELLTIINKIVQYENLCDCGQWRKKINFVAGVGGFGKLEDSILESATKQFISHGIPKGYETSMTYASWQSPYCPDPRLFHAETINRLNDGCLLWVYVGHGHVQQLDQMNVSGTPFHIFDVRDVQKVNSQNGLPIAVFLACYTAAFDAQYDCLAEELLRRERGPVAVLGGTRVTLPYAMSVMSLEMLGNYFDGEAETLGEVLLAAKRAMVMENPGKESFRQMIDSLAQVMSPTKKMLAEERMENISLFHLIGDPLLRIKRPLEIQIESEERIKPGEYVTVKGNSPVAGKLTVELAYPRDRLTFRHERRDAIEWNEEFLGKLQQTYLKANDRTLRKQSFDVPKGPFTLSIPIPAECRGNCDINAYLQTPTRFALGSTDVMVR